MKRTSGIFKLIRCHNRKVFPPAFAALCLLLFGAGAYCAGTGENFEEFLEVTAGNMPASGISAMAPVPAPTPSSSLSGTIDPFSYLPILNIPKRDTASLKGMLPRNAGPEIKKRAEQRGMILKAFYSVQRFSDRFVLQYSYVFPDEDHPSRIMDAIYDTARQKLGTKKINRLDLESFYIHTDITGEPVQVCFRFGGVGTHSREQDYEAGLPTHYSDCLPASDLAWNKLRPVIFVNTWNHLFSEKPHADMEYLRYSEYPVSEGARLK